MLCKDKHTPVKSVITETYWSEHRLTEMEVEARAPVTVTKAFENAEVRIARYKTLGIEPFRFQMNSFCSLIVQQVS